MADDDKTAEAPKPIEPSTTQPKSATPGQTPRRSSEWTASDSRGPLEKAEDGFDAGDKPIAPPHEADVHDTGSETRPLSSAHAGFGPTPASDASGAPASSESSSAAAAAPGAAPIAPDSLARPRGRLLWPLAAAIVLGAASGAGSAYLLHGYTNDEPSRDSQVTSLAARIEALEKRADPQPAIAKVEASMAALSSRVASLESGAGQAPAGEAAAPVPSQAASPAGKPTESSQAAAPADPAPPAPDLGPLNQKVATLQSDLAALKAQGADTKALQGKVAALEGALAGMKTATAAAQADVATVQGQQKSLAGRVAAPAFAAVADSLVQQIDQGQSYATQVDALVALGADPAKIAVLRQNAEKGVPSAKTLAATFEPLAEPISATARKPPPNAGFMDRLKSGALSMVSIRRADDTSGDDLPSRVARVKAALAHDDVPGAVVTWEALPADAKAKGATWGALAKTAAEAMTAARALQHEAIAALAAKKS